MSLNRRAALGALASLPALGIPAAGIMLAQTSHMLAALIAEHRRTRDVFDAAWKGLLAVQVDPDASVKGLAGTDYNLDTGKERIAGYINAHARDLLSKVAKIEAVLGRAFPDAEATIERERLAALARLDEAFAAKDAATRRWEEACDAEEAALQAVCAHRCGSPAELAAKMSHLAPLRLELTDAQHDALFKSLVPEAEASR